MNNLILGSVKANNNTIETTFSCNGRMRKFFKNRKFVAEYNISIEGTPPSILTIPFLAVACPVAWANNADIYVDECDETFLYSLKLIKKTLREFYPQMNFGGRIQVKNVVKVPNRNLSRKMVLYSGGVDSLATLMRHQSENPLLFTVMGKNFAPPFIADIAKDVSNKCGLELRTVNNNPYGILDLPMLAIFRKQTKGDWYRQVMHGLALLGLSAPVTYVDKIGTVYIAASLTNEMLEPYGSHPEIDNNVKWTGTHVIHDGHELSRQQKIFLIANQMKKTLQSHQLRVCNFPNLNGNCGRCEKCVRTIIGLEVAGMDPNLCGLPLQKDLGLYAKESLLKGNWDLDPHICWVWSDIQSSIIPNMQLPNPELRSFIEWLPTVDFKTIKSSTTRKSSKLKASFWEKGKPLMLYSPYFCHVMFRKFYNRFERYLHI